MVTGYFVIDVFGIVGVGEVFNGVVVGSVGVIFVVVVVVFVDFDIV